METIEEVILDDIWTVFNEANKDREPMLSGDDEDKITALLEKYHQAKLKLLGIPDVSNCDPYIHNTAVQFGGKCGKCGRSEKI